MGTPFFHERADAFGKVLGPGTFTLARDFDVFQVVLIFSKSSGINLALDVLIGNNRSGSQFLGKFHRFFIEGIVGHNAVDNAQILGFLCAHRASGSADVHGPFRPQLFDQEIGTARIGYRVPGPD